MFCDYWRLWGAQENKSPMSHEAQSLWCINVSFGPSAGVDIYFPSFSARVDFASISFVSCATATEKLDSMGSAMEEPEEEGQSPFAPHMSLSTSYA